MDKEFNYYKFKQLEAVESILTSPPDYFCRKVIRWFSKEFSTPILEVYKLSWDFVLQHYYEATLEKLDYNSVYDIAIYEFIPELGKKEEEEDQAFADSLIEEQKEQLRKKEESSQSLDNNKTDQSEKESNVDIPIIPPIDLNFED